MSSSVVTQQGFFSSTDSISDTVGENETLKRDDWYVPEKVLQPAMQPAVQPQVLTSRDLHPAFDTMRWLCAISHVGLIVLLASFAFRGPDKGNPSIISFNYPSFNITDGVDANIGQTLQSGVKLGFGWIVTGWTIILTLTTQKLALRRQLSLYNSLTAKHDANEAWMGFGSALMASLKWRQLGFQESRNSLLVPLLYLAGIASLHSVATGMFGLVLAPVNTTMAFSSQGLPDFTATVGNALTGSSALLTMSSLSTFNFPGLASDGVGVVYDIPDPTNVSHFPSFIQEVEVPATYFNVTCGSLSGSVQNSTESGPAFFFEPGFGLESTVLPGFDTFPSFISQRTVAIRPAPWGPWVDNPVDPDLSSWPSSILIFTTLPVSDSSNDFVKPVSVNPPMTWSNTRSTTSQITALACNLTVEALPNKAVIDPRSNSLLSLEDQTNKTLTMLKSFPATIRPPLNNTSTNDNLIALLFNLCTEDDNDAVCGISVYEAEQFVMESLNIFPDLLLPASSSDVSADIDLADLENILSRMTAIEFWAEGQGNNLKFSNRISSSEGFSISKTFVTNSNTVDFTEFVLVFAINRTQVLISLQSLEGWYRINIIPRKLFGVIAIAIVLLLLVSPSLFNNNNLKIDSIGILQMIWLASDHPELQQSIIKLDDPSTDELRKEGMLIKRNFHSHVAEALP
ncbi:hypothetical protein J3R30DRAFT_3881994 [Lentinula aciculospora]|uniref:Uncharacterized protein n=1 Tax=Lentinula aciculospora TaxID=153920 RepID=A0A9W9ACW6_9AGAR|nr:hypothetical protein J3R30DRAFT_3881994 [Lentinula aciculospora]